MEQELDRIQLHTGEWLDAAILVAPQPERTTELTTFHDGSDAWIWSIDRSLRGCLPELEARFYTGRIQGQLVADVGIYEHAGIGLFGLVFTEPRHRRKGICAALCEAAVSDFRRRGGRYMTLVAEYGSSAYRIYRRVGFREIQEEDGCMIWEADEGAFDGLFEPHAVRPQPLDWRHWPGLCGLAMTRGGWGELRAKNRLLGPYEAFETQFLLAMQQQLRGELRAAVLEGRNGQTLGFAMLGQRWPQAEEWALDLWVYPGCWPHAPGLLASLGPLPQPTRCYVDSQSERLAVLQAAGFHEWTLLERMWFTAENPLIVMRNG